MFFSGWNRDGIGAMAGIKRRLQAAADRQQQAMRLGDLLAERLDVFCWCNRCGHNAVVSTAALAGHLSADLPVPEAGAHMRCTRCQGKDVSTRPAWPSPGLITRHTD